MWMKIGEIIRFPTIGEKRSDSIFEVGEDGGGFLHDGAYEKVKKQNETRDSDGENGNEF